MGEIRKDIGSRVREIRKRLRMTQKALGEILGVGISAVSAYESGESAIPPESLLKIAELGNVSLDWLMKGEKPSPPCVNESPEFYGALPEPLHRIAKLIQGHPGTENEIFNQLIDFYAEQGKRKNEEG